MVKIFSFLFAVAMFLAFSAIDGVAQVSGSSTARAAMPAGYNMLTGEIKWKRTFGLPPAKPGGTTLPADVCQVFHILALEPDDSAFITAGRLTRGRDDELYYRCKYEMPVPHSRRIVIRPGLGSIDKYKEVSEYYRTQWIGGPKDYSGGNVTVPNLSGGPDYRVYIPGFLLEFDRPYKYVTVGPVKASYLAFELGNRREIEGRSRTFIGNEIRHAALGTYLVDWCLNWETGCGKPAADAFCKVSGFREAKVFTKRANVPDTYTLGDRRPCNKNTRASCDAFERIECVRD